jgi:SNF2 family DNA or RNA helicase
MLHTWPTEVAKWDQFAGLRVSMIHGTVAERYRGLAAEADVYLMHYDNLDWLATSLDAMVKLLPFDMAVLDESTKIKNPSTERFKSFKKIRPQLKVVLALTGTPTPLHVGDLFGQVYACDGGKRLGRNVTTFRQLYMTAKWLPGVPVPLWEPQPDAVPRVFKALDGMALRLAAADHLAMPELIHNTIAVELPEPMMKFYRKLARDLVIELEEGKVTAANAAAVSMKLRQFASGIVYTDTGPKPVHPMKVDALVELIEAQCGQPLLVATAFRSEVHHLRHILKGLGYGDVPCLMGGMHDKEANAILDKWNTGAYPVLLCHPETTAHGLNLQAGGHSVCWFTMTFNLEHYIQFNARVWRQGQPSPHVVIHHIAAAGTIDQHVAEVITKKDAKQNDLFVALLKHAKEEKHVH